MHFAYTRARKIGRWLGQHANHDGGCKFEDDCTLQIDSASNYVVCSLPPRGFKFEIFILAVFITALRYYARKCDLIRNLFFWIINSSFTLLDKIQLSSIRIHD